MHLVASRGFKIAGESLLQLLARTLVLTGQLVKLPNCLLQFGPMGGGYYPFKNGNGVRAYRSWAASNSATCSSTSQ